MTRCWPTGTGWRSRHCAGRPRCSAGRTGSRVPPRRSTSSCATHGGPRRPGAARLAARRITAPACSTIRPPWPGRRSHCSRRPATDRLDQAIASLVTDRKVLRRCRRQLLHHRVRCRGRAARRGGAAAHRRRQRHPAGNGLMAEVLARLFHLTGDPPGRTRARRVIGAFSGLGERCRGADPAGRGRPAGGGHAGGGGRRPRRRPRATCCGPRWPRPIPPIGVLRATARHCRRAIPPTARRRPPAGGRLRLPRRRLRTADHRPATLAARLVSRHARA